MTFQNPRFDGHTYNTAFDQVRLTGQIERVFNLMQDGQFRTLEEISATTGDPAASVSAQLRNLRKPRFGGHMVMKKNRGDRSHGLYEYRLMVFRDRHIGPKGPVDPTGPKSLLEAFDREVKRQETEKVKTNPQTDLFQGAA